MKKRFLPLVMLFAAVTGTQAQETLPLGGYETITEDYSPRKSDPVNLYGLYWGSFFDVAPINYYVAMSGSQQIYYADELAPMAGKDITAISFKYYNEMGYDDYSRRVTVYLTETDKQAYEQDLATTRWKLFDTALASPSLHKDVVLEGLLTLYMNGELELKLDAPYHYSGDNHLVVTIVADGDNDNCTDGGFALSFFYSNDLKNRMMGYEDNNFSMNDVLESDCLLAQYGMSINSEAPVIQFTYTDGETTERWETIVTKTNVDFNAIKGVTAYKVSGIENGVIVKEQITEAPKNTPVLLHLSVNPSFTDSGKAYGNVTGNQLRGSDGTVYGAGIYVLGEKDGKAGFVKLADDDVVKAGRAYLVVNSGESDFYPLEGTATAINGIHHTTPSHLWHTLNGQRVETPTQKGIYIKNGKKVTVK